MESLMVKINPSTGEIVIGHHTFGPQLVEADFLSSELGALAREIRRPNRNYYELWTQLSPELEIGLTLGFLAHGSLQRVSAQFVKPGARGTPWSRAVEDDIKRFHDKWLQEQLGEPPYQFAWGTVISRIEPHWYSANIVIDYTNVRRDSTGCVSQI